MDETNDGRGEEERRLTGRWLRGASDGVMNQIPAARGWVKQQGRLVCLVANSSLPTPTRGAYELGGCDVGSMGLKWVKMDRGDRSGGWGERPSPPSALYSVFNWQAP